MRCKLNNQRLYEEYTIIGSSSIGVVWGIDITGKRALKIATEWKATYLLVCCLIILSGDSLHLWVLGTLVYLTLFGIDTVENSWDVNWIHKTFTRNIQFFYLQFLMYVLTLFVIDTAEKVWGVNWIHRDFTRNIQLLVRVHPCVFRHLKYRGKSFEASH